MSSVIMIICPQIHINIVETERFWQQTGPFDPTQLDRDLAEHLQHGKACRGTGGNCCDESGDTLSPVDPQPK